MRDRCSLPGRLNYCLISRDPISIFSQRSALSKRTRTLGHYHTEPQADAPPREANNVRTTPPSLNQTPIPPTLHFNHCPWFVLFFLACPLCVLYLFGPGLGNSFHHLPSPSPLPLPPQQRCRAARAARRPHGRHRCPHRRRHHRLRRRRHRTSRLVAPCRASPRFRDAMPRRAPS